MVRAARSLLVVFAACVAIGAATLCCAAEAQSQKQYAIDISRQPLMQAMLAFADQTGLLFSFFPETPDDENVLVGPVTGRLTADAALLQLLKPNGFGYEWIGERSVYVAREQSDGDGASEEEARPTSAKSLASRDRQRAESRKRRQEIEFVVVIGTRMSTTETESRSQSVTVMDQQKIDSYGVSTMSELFEHLPQVPFTIFEGVRSEGDYYPNLRGFGSGTTLVLVNGHRVLSSATGYDQGSFDINTIPLTAIQRIEVLLGTPPIASGADASGGVINIILKNEIPEPTVELRYGTAAGGSEERRATLGLGTSMERIRGALTLDVFDRSRLSGAERDITRDQDYRRFGGRDARTLDASPGNIRSLGGENLPGLESSFAAVPVDISGTNLTPQDFLSTAGQRNLDSATRFRDIFPETSRVSLIASGEVDLSPSSVGFAEVLAGRSRNYLETGLFTLSGALVPASNAFNPFDAPVIVNKSLEELAPQAAVTKTEYVRVLTGIRQTWSAWTAEGWISANRDRTHWSTNALDPARTVSALASSDPVNALNPFSDGPAGSPELLASLITTYRDLNDQMDGFQVRASAHGPIATLPSGDLTLMIGGEWHREDWRITQQTFSTHQPTVSPYRTVSSTFAELQIPLIGPRMHFPAAENVLLSFGFRTDDYTDLGARSTPQYGLTWSIFDGLTVSASYSDIHQTPTMWNMYDPPAAFPFPLSDPSRRGETSSVALLVGGNRDLKPSFGHSWTASIEFTPPENPNVRISLGYWRTALNDQIERVEFPIMLTHEDSFSERFVRAERTAQDVEAGVPGVLQSLDIRAQNLGWLRASGLDGGASFARETNLGRFSSTISAAWYESFETSLVEDLPTSKRVGIASEHGTIPTWRATATIGWNRGPLTVVAAANAVSAYDDANWETRTGRTIDEQVLIDLQGSLQLGAFIPPTSALSAIKITAGVTNAFNTTQQFSSIFDGMYGFDVSQATSLRQRFWYLRLSAEL